MSSSNYSHTFGSCYAWFDGSLFRIGNALVERTWRIIEGGLYATSLFDKVSGYEWLASPATLPSLTLPVALNPARGALDFAVRDGVALPAEEPSLVVELRHSQVARQWTWRFKIFERSPGIAMQLVLVGFGEMPPVVRESVTLPSPTGIEQSQPPSGAAPAIPDAVDCFEIDPLHLTLTQTTLHDQTDVHDNLVHERRWLLHPAEPRIRDVENVFDLQHRLEQRGLIILKLAPLPHARPVKSSVDLEVEGASVRVFGHGLDSDGAGYPTIVIPYTGGRTGRIAAMLRYQRQLRPYQTGRDGLLLSNTWGDRSKDGRICEAFLFREIDAAAKLGVEVVQIDDGWQRGASGNSVVAGGVWTGFWERDANFWSPHPERFPNGLKPLANFATDRGIKLGLWYAPDSLSDFANWRRDADQILSIHRDFNVRHFKIDGVKMYTPVGEANLNRFYDAVLAESNAAVVFDHDVTAAVRPGYFGVPRVGPVFVENRYTDWHRYWPHCTLRNLWQLAQYVDPLRLRMEFLNHTRNAHLYEGDPLAPVRYSAEYLFASVMFASPLAWFEVSNLPHDYSSKVAPLIALWKTRRDELFAGDIIPIGSPPDGTQWTGFASVRDGGKLGDLLIFRELTKRDEVTIDVPMFSRPRYRPTLLAGSGEATLVEGMARVSIAKPLSFAWFSLEA